MIIEIQVSSQPYITKRAALYSSDMLVRQYAVEGDERKGSFDYSGLRAVYTVVLMVESPMGFHRRPGYIHRFAQADELDPGFKPDFLQKYCFIELGKFLRLSRRGGLDGAQVKAGGAKKAAGGAQKAGETAQIDNELAEWLLFIADDSPETKRRLASKDKEFLMMTRELERMSLNRAEIFRIMDEELAELDRIAERNEALREGRELERKAAEAGRKKAEAGRKKAEAERKKAEAEKAAMAKEAEQRKADLAKAEQEKAAIAKEAEQRKADLAKAEQEKATIAKEAEAEKAAMAKEAEQEKLASIKKLKERRFNDDEIADILGVPIEKIESL